MENDRFEVGRDLGIALINTIDTYNTQYMATTGERPTVFEIIGVLHMLAADYHEQLRQMSED